MEIRGGYIKYMPETDVFYMRINTAEVAKTLERGDNILVDVDSRGAVIAVEIIDASKVAFSQVARVMEEFGLQMTQAAAHLLPA